MPDRVICLLAEFPDLAFLLIALDPRSHPMRLVTI
jgi:hypothetical protein